MLHIGITQFIYKGVGYESCGHMSESSKPRVCNYCGEFHEQLQCVGFMYKVPITYCAMCVRRLKRDKGRMTLDKNVMVVNLGDDVNDVPVLIGYEEIQGVDVKMEDWLKAEKKRLEEERERILKEKGYEDLFRFPVGETRIKLVMKQPDIKEGQQGRQFAVFDIEVEGKKVQIGVNLRSPMYREFIGRMADNKLEFSVIRTGMGLDTRYNFKD